MKAKLKTIDIQGKEWFDRINGNSYHSARITINYGMKSEQNFRVPFSYGYGSMYEQNTFELLRGQGIIKETDRMYTLQESGVIIRSSIQRNCLKRDVVAWGE